MKNLNYGIIGLGKFGMSVAVNYSNRGGNVLAIDRDEARVQEVSDFVTSAVRAVMTDADVVSRPGPRIAQAASLLHEKIYSVNAQVQVE